MEAHWQRCPVYDSHSLLSVVAAKQHLLIGEVECYNKACRTALMGSGSRDTKRNLETGREASREVGPEMERTWCSFCRVFLAAELLDNDLWISKASKGHCITICGDTKLQPRNGASSLFFDAHSAISEVRFADKCARVLPCYSLNVLLVSACLPSQW